MKIPVMLNEVLTVLDEDPAVSLLHVLRKNGQLSAKCGCSQGHCGSCTVLLDDRAVASCIIPLAVVRDATIVTLEHFSKRPEYALIMDSFSKAGIRLCGYCNAGKILATYSLISSWGRPSRQQVCDTVRHLGCPCTERDSLVQGVMYAVAAFQSAQGRRRGR